MLVLSRHVNEKIVFPQYGIEVMVVGVKPNGAIRLGINCPNDVICHRAEIQRKIESQVPNTVTGGDPAPVRFWDASQKLRPNKKPHTAEEKGRRPVAMASHTKGPLEVQNKTNIFGVRNDVGYMTCIASTGNFSSNQIDVETENEANATLFASAPKLLQLLKESIGIMDKGRSIEEWLNDAHAEIKKAEGGDQQS